MVQYASAAELAVRLEHDVDTAKADLLLKSASATFSRLADMWWAEQTVTWTIAGTGARTLRLPYQHINSITSVTVAGNTVTDYTRINDILYRQAGWGSCTFPPDSIVVILQHGLTAVTDDVKGVILDMVEPAYEVVAGLTAEQIDDYSARYAAGVGEIVTLTESAESLAASYRGVAVA